MSEFRLNLVLMLLYKFHDIFSIILHIFFKLKLETHIFLLIELHITWFEKMSPNINSSLDRRFRYFPFRDPLSSIKVAKLNVFTCDSYISIQSLLGQAHKDWILKHIPWAPNGYL